MSDNKTPVAAVPTQENAETESEQKQSLYRRGRTFLATHKKPAIAVGLLAGLVGVAAIAGKKTDPLPDFDEVSPTEETPETESESADTTVA